MTGKRKSDKTPANAGARPWLEKLIEFVDREVDEENTENARRRATETENYGDETFATERREALTAMLNAPNIEKVWTALERRSDVDAITSREDAMRQGMEFALKHIEDENLLESFKQRTLSRACLERELEILDGSDRIDFPVGRNIYDMAEDLIGAVTDMRAQGIPAATRARRKEKLKEVQSAVSAMKKSIAFLFDRDDPDVHSFDWKARNECVNAIANDWLHSQAMLYGATIDQEGAAVAYQIIRRLVADPRAILDTIEGRVHEWSMETPELAKPNDPQAARLIFMRRLTDYFRQQYSTPLRGCVLAVTEAFFDCDGLDESAIAKLAP